MSGVVMQRCSVGMPSVGLRSVGYMRLGGVVWKQLMCAILFRSLVLHNQSPAGIMYRAAEANQRVPS